MARRRRSRKRISLRLASIDALKSALSEARRRLEDIDAEYRAQRLPSSTGSPESELEKINVDRIQIERRLTEIESLRQQVFRDPRHKNSFFDSILGSPLTKEGEARHSELVGEMSRLLERQENLRDAQIRQQYFLDRITRRRSWVTSVEKALDERRRKQAALENLKAAAASKNQAHRALAESVKRQLARSPRCPYCAGPLGDTPQADHIYPLSKGGRSINRNMVWVCSNCNQKKGELTLAGFIRKLALDRDEIERRLLALGKDV